MGNANNRSPKRPHLDSENKGLHSNILTVDNSYGDMPDACVNEPLPHLLKAGKETPDASAPLVWVYPFEEYNAAESGEALSEMYAGDWFIRNAINAGVPLNTVVSTGSFCKGDQSIYSGSILISPVPSAGDAYEEAIIRYVQTGGKVIFYGSVTHSSAKFRRFIGVKLTDGIEGELAMTVCGKKQKSSSTTAC